MYACAPAELKMTKVGFIADNEFDPAEWGKLYPQHYESWKKTKDPKPSGKSKYRKGWDKDKVVYDKLSEYPFLALLYYGWGLGDEYNEARGHYYSIIDQLEIDPSRTGPGGVCLACKSPFHKSYTKKYGMKYLTAKFKEAVNMYPKKHRELGPACIDCHKSSDMGLQTNKQHLAVGLKMLGKNSLNHSEKRLLSCAQCHMTYYVPRTKKMKVAGDVIPPWNKSSWGKITIENIIKDLLKDYKRLEWKQKVTGFKMPFIRHPEFELFTNNSTHFNANLTCVDCHMPYTRMGSRKISDHDVTSPLKNGLKACQQCHTERTEWLTKQILTTQDRINSLYIRAGYQNATTAKLFELVHKNQKSGKKFNTGLYAKAKKYYKEAFLRLIFIGAENSSGFHNPTESARVLADSLAFAAKSEAWLRQMLAANNIAIPAKIQLELKKYLNNRGKKKLQFKPDQEFKDPYSIQDLF